MLSYFSIRPIRFPNNLIGFREVERTLRKVSNGEPSAQHWPGATARGPSPAGATAWIADSHTDLAKTKILWGLFEGPFFKTGSTQSLPKIRKRRIFRINRKAIVGSAVRATVNRRVVGSRPT